MKESDAGTFARMLAKAYEAQEGRIAQLEDDLISALHDAREAHKDAETRAQRWSEQAAALREAQRQVAQAKHQRDAARVALNDIHATLAPLREEANDGEIGGHQGATAVVACLNHAVRGLGLSQQDEQPEAGR